MGQRVQCLALECFQLLDRLVFYPLQKVILIHRKIIFCHIRILIDIL